MYALEGGSVGFQIGGEATDLILLVMNDRGMESILSSKVTACDEFQLAIPWRVVLQQRPPLLHQPRAACDTRVLPVQNCSANGIQCLIRWSHPRGPLQPSSISLTGSASSSAAPYSEWRASHKSTVNVAMPQCRGR